MTRFDLFLFSTAPETIRPAAAAGIAGFIIDWEWIGKEERQTAADTEVNRDTVEDLRRARAATRARLLCRLNAVGETTAREIEEAIEAGADELLLPMIRSPRDVEAVLARVGGRCGVGILVETVDAAGRARELASLPLSRVYVGLNDLAIERRTPHIFAPLADGLLDRIREAVDRPFGFGGLTVPERGDPLPCRLLIAELVR
ncbi:MAG TPA: aldolase/citrate lyase family protein, partial [Thermoanaerobaculia bacterium]|nr:aldolase/citrate lyase family protein [Thermoanaerobaculia bacterium]